MKEDYVFAYAILDCMEERREKPTSTKKFLKWLPTVIHYVHEAVLVQDIMTEDILFSFRRVLMKWWNDSTDQRLKELNREIFVNDIKNSIEQSFFYAYDGPRYDYVSGDKDQDRNSLEAFFILPTSYYADHFSDENSRETASLVENLRDGHRNSDWKDYPIYGPMNGRLSLKPIFDCFTEQVSERKRRRLIIGDVQMILSGQQLDQECRAVWNAISPCLPVESFNEDWIQSSRTYFTETVYRELIGNRKDEDENRRWQKNESCCFGKDQFGRIWYQAGERKTFYLVKTLLDGDLKRRSVK